MRAGSPQEAHASTTAAAITTTTPAVEHVQRGGGRINAFPKRSSSRKVSATAMNGKLAAAVAGTVAVAPSAGLVMNRVRNTSGGGSDDDDDDLEMMDTEKGSAVVQAAKKNDPTKTTTTTTGETAADLDAMIEEKVTERREQEKKAIVEKVLKNATEARQKVDSDVYMKSLQKEKSAIASALESLKNSPPTAAPAPQVKPPPGTIYSMQLWFSLSCDQPSFVSYLFCFRFWCLLCYTYSFLLHPNLNCHHEMPLERICQSP